MSRMMSQQAVEETRRHCGVVIPVYLPDAVDQPLGAALLEDLVVGLLGLLADPSTLCLAADGGGRSREVATGLAGRFHLTLHAAEDNKGKLAAVRGGMRRLLRRPELRFLAVMDQDGDHFPNELPNLVRAAMPGTRQRGKRALVIGRRLSRHRPMGFMRGEIEELADRILLDALAYHAAHNGKPLDLSSVFIFDEYPDFHSGFKLFTRTTARSVFMKEPTAAGLPQASLRHACEAVMSVEAILSGARLLCVQRSTINRQPVSAFGLYDRIRLAADKISWPCRRLAVPESFVRQWLDNHIPRLHMHTLLPEGREALAAIRRTVLTDIGAQAPREDPWEPGFL